MSEKSEISLVTVGTGSVGIVALVATLMDASALMDSGGIYALVGSFAAIFATIIILFTLTVFGVYVALTVLIATLLHLEVPIVVQFIIWLDRRMETDWQNGRHRAPLAQVWHALFGDPMDFQSASLNNACRLAQVGALPIAVLLVYYILRF